jgi:hypothetical protein
MEKQQFTWLRPETTSRVDIVGKLGHLCGSLETMQGRQHIPRGTYEFIALSRTTFSQDIVSDPAVEHGELALPPDNDIDARDEFVQEWRNRLSEKWKEEPGYTNTVLFDRIRDMNGYYKEKWENENRDKERPRGCEDTVFSSYYSMYKPWPL